MYESTVRTRHCTALLVGLSIASGAFAQDRESLNVDLAECVGLQSEAARFACYERQVAAATGEAEPATEAAPVAEPASPPEAAPVAPAPRRAAAPPMREQASAAEAVPAAEARSAAADDNEDTDRGLFLGRTSNDSDETESEEILATITAARETIPNTWVITLDNGQVWQQVRTKRYPIREGADVRLYPTRWGTSWRLTIPARGSYINVRRVE